MNPGIQCIYTDLINTYWAFVHVHKYGNVVDNNNNYTNDMNKNKNMLIHINASAIYQQICKSGSKFFSMTIFA